MKLKPHQDKVVKQFKDGTRGLLVYHGLGSGKTITSIACGEVFPNMKKTVVVPASLQDNFRKEIAKVGAPSSKYSVVSYEMFAKRNTPVTDGFVIFDEAHRLRNSSGHVASACIFNAQQAERILLLSGTPIVNYPTDIVPLFRLIAPGSLPGPTIFNRTFLYKEASVRRVPIKVLGVKIREVKVLASETRLINRSQLLNALKGLVSFYDGKSSSPNNYPRHTERFIRVPMSQEQEDMHIKAAKNTLTNREVAMIRGGVTTNMEGNSSDTSKRINSFLNKTRQIVNMSPGDGLSPKMTAIAATVREGPLPAVVYSNFKSAGVLRLADELKQTHRVAVFTGEESKAVKKKMVADFNDKKIDVMLITASGSEGLDLKRTRQMHVMEPHWNQSRLDQAIGRAIRYKSHDNLSKDKQHVDVYHWLSVFAPMTRVQYIKSLVTGNDISLRVSSDEYLLKISQKKTQLNQKFEKVLHEASI
jgi:SNF2 family DNA or RNA helicase